MKLSILICHLPERKADLERLLAGLLPQCPKDEVEVRIEEDDGTTRIGVKRNKLLAQAQGEYVAFVDDDDEVMEDYVASIFKAIEEKPDCVGIEGILKAKDADFIFSHSIEYCAWYDDGRVFYRTPNHLNPIRREHALKAGFAEKDFGEDMQFSNDVLPYLKTEVYIDHPIYLYHYEDRGKAKEEEA